MIYTVTLNPSVDLLVTIEDLNKGKLNRMSGDSKIPGGKAVNVSRALKHLEIPSTATGFVGGFTGKYIKDWFDARDIINEFTWVKEDTRINIKLLESNEETIINGLGPKINIDEFNDFLYRMSRVREGDFVIMGGSIPVNAPKEIYERLVSICRSNGAHFVLDIPAEHLKDNLASRPLLITPTVDLLNEMFEKDLSSLEDIIEMSKKCIELGAKNVLVPLEDLGGALMVTEYGVFRSLPIAGEVVNTLSAKDAMLAAWMGTYMRRNDEVEAFRTASAALSAATLVEDLPSKEEVTKIAEKVVVEELR